MDQSKEDDFPINPTKITIIKPLSELAKYPKVRKIDHYIYDFDGKGSTIWDMVFGTHNDCRGKIEDGTMVFACYNCFNQGCYWKKRKEELKKEGYDYRDQNEIVSK